VPLLKPIGDHNRNHVRISRGRGRRKRSSNWTGEGEQEIVVAERPKISLHVNVGFNSTVRKLESLAHRPGTHKQVGQEGAVSTGDAGFGFPAVVFVCKSALADPVSELIPLLVARASLHSEGADAIRLVDISASAEATLSAVLGLPRLAALAVDDDAPGAQPLINYLREEIEPIDASWLREVSTPAYLPLKVNTEEAVIGEKKASRKRKAGARP
jgi:ribonuclease P/MRP protein subunit POP3